MQHKVSLQLAQKLPIRALCSEEQNWPGILGLRQVSNAPTAALKGGRGGRCSEHSWFAACQSHLTPGAEQGGERGQVRKTLDARIGTWVSFVCS